MKPTLFMAVGIPASGKTAYFKNMAYLNDVIVYSSDELRQELFGDAKCQSNNERVFAELHRRIKHDLNCGKNVAYDATNISKKRRIHFMKQIEKIECNKKCICFMTPYSNCMGRNVTRPRVVPYDVVWKMYTNWQPPHYSEGFDEIIYRFSISAYDGFELDNLFGDNEFSIMKFDQLNSHHTATLGKHCVNSYEKIKSDYPFDRELQLAALLHDIGKQHVQTMFNKKGVFDGNYHYYNHNNVSAYDSLFYLYNLGLSTEQMVRISNLIYYHMHPFLSWKQSEKARMKDEKLLGKKFIDDVWKLHEADLAAH